MEKSLENWTSKFLNVKNSRAIRIVQLVWRYSVPLRIQSECGKIRSRKTPNMDIFHAVFVFQNKKTCEKTNLSRKKITISVAISQNYQ